MKYITYREQIKLLLKRRYHEWVTNLTYAAVSLTTVHQFLTFRKFCDGGEKGYNVSKSRQCRCEDAALIHALFFCSPDQNPSGRCRLFVGDDEGNIHSYNFHQPLISLFNPSKKNTGAQQIYYPVWSSTLYR